MPRPGPAPLDHQALPVLDKRRVALLLELSEEGGHWHVKRARKRLQRRKRGRGDAVLDLRHHAGRKPRLPAQVGDRHSELHAELADLMPNRDLQAVLARAL